MVNAAHIPTHEGVIKRVAHPLHTQASLDPLLDRIGDARIVLLGEATHGTSEYYLWRARLTQRLIEEKGFSFVAVEGDWPDCYRINRYVKGQPDAGQSALSALHAFERWPTWMWANWEVAALVEWMRRHNDSRPAGQRAGFYGLDVYSLWDSLAEVTRFLEQNHPDAVAAAYRAFDCFQPYDSDVQAYARASQLVPLSCEKEVIDLLMETQRRAHQTRYDGDAEAAFNAEQNARVAVGAEHYYRTMVEGGPESWNIRDRHMTDTLDHLLAYHGPDSRAIVWEHNTHIGDARATPMSDYGMVNVGQLVRERHAADDVVLVGFGSYRGTVIAGRAWGAPMKRLTVDEARPESWEGILHETIGEDSLLIFAESPDASEVFSEVRGHRAIGVVYDPYIDRSGSYVPTSLSGRYDAFVYLEETRALHPLHIEEHAALEPPETYPWGV
jgi:erythromycin esterase-like protein